MTATLLLLVLPLLRRTSAANAPADQAAVTSVYRDYKRQIEADYAARTITEAERDASLADLATRLGQELGQDPSADVAPSERSRWIAAMVLVACVPVVAGLLYFTLGNPAAVSGAATASAESPHGSGTGDDPKMVAIVDALAKKLQANPDDGEGWAMLGRSYRVLGRFDASAMAYAEAAKRLPPNAVVFTDWAEAVAQAQGKTLTGQPTELLDRALAVDPNYPKALALAGSAALERNDNATAAALWKRLRATLPADSPNLAEVDEALARVGVTPPRQGRRGDADARPESGARHGREGACPDVRRRARQGPRRGRRRRVQHRRPRGGRSEARRQDRAGRHRVHPRARSRRVAGCRSPR